MSNFKDYLINTNEDELDDLEKEYKKLQDIMDKVVGKGGNPKNTANFKKANDVMKKMMRLM